MTVSLSVLYSLLDWNYLKQNMLLKRAKRTGKGNEWFNILSPQAVIYKAGSFSFTSTSISRDKGLISIIIPLTKIYILTKKDPLCKLISEVTNIYPLKKQKSEREMLRIIVEVLSQFESMDSIISIPAEYTERIWYSVLNN